MRLYNVLIVDDEPHVVGTISALLQCQSTWNLEVYSAYSGEEALVILNSTRIDVLITDMRMPVMDGLELIKLAHTIWPECKTMLLTAYSDFEYAYEAIRIGIDAYLLKTESDERLLDTFGRIIFLLEQSRIQSAAEIPIDAFHRRELNAHLLQKLLQFRHDKKQHEQLLRLIGTTSTNIHWLLCVILSDRSRHENSSVLEWLIKEKVAYRAEMIASCIIENKLFILMKSNAQISSLIGALELVQESYDDRYQQDISFVVGIFEQPERRLSDLYQDICRYIESMNGGSSGFVHTLPESFSHIEPTGYMVVDTIKAYIRNHLNGDLSLRILSNLVGYNSSYLSKLFHDITGMKISSYIAQLKIQRIRELIIDNRLSLGDIAEDLGFASRSYFNRYVKRLTGYTPQQFREVVLVENSDKKSSHT